MPNRVPPPREFNWARTLRTLSFWALLIVGSIALVQFASSRRQEAVEISYTQFTEQLDAANIAAVEITERQQIDRKSTRLNSSHLVISYAVFCLKKKKKIRNNYISHND